MGTMQHVMTLCCREQWEGGVFRSVELQGDALVLSSASIEGFAVLPAVDAGEALFRWSRVSLEAALPEQGGVRVYARASDTPAWPELERLRADEQITLRELFGPSVCAGTELWLNLTGRWLWLGVELTGSGAQRPRVDAVRVLMEGDHMTDYLPAIYREQDFTTRYLSIFTAMYQDMEREIEEFPRQLDPESASAEMLSYLASWLCMEQEDEATLRRRFTGVLDEYERMYTPEGIRRSVERLTGAVPVIIEHFSVDPNDPACSDPELYRRLYGENPYRFFILLPRETFSSQRQMERFAERMRELIPADTEFELILLKPGAQLDWQSYLGMNASIGAFNPAILDESMTIHFDTTIGGTSE